MVVESLLQLYFQLTFVLRQTAHIFPANAAVRGTDSRIEMLGEGLEIIEVMVMLQQMRNGWAAHHLPCHDLPPVLAHVPLKAGFATGYDQYLKMHLRAVAALFCAQCPAFAVGQGIDALIDATAGGIFAHFVQGKQTVVAGGRIVDQRIRRAIPRFGAVATVSLY